MDVSLAEVSVISKKDLGKLLEILTLDSYQIEEDPENPFVFRVEIFGVVNLLAAASSAQRMEWLVALERLKVSNKNYLPF